MRMSCNGCRVLRKGCSEDCSIRPCLQWIKSPDAQGNATVFLAKFYGRAGLLNLINAGPDHLRPAIFRSLLYEACGRIVNPIYGSVGLLWSNNWHLCQAAVEAVLKGAPIVQIPSETAGSIPMPPPLKSFDIRHVPKDDATAVATAAAHNLHRISKSGRTNFKRSAAKAAAEPAAKRALSHESSTSHEWGPTSSGEGGAGYAGAASPDRDSAGSAETVEASMVTSHEEQQRKQEVVELELTLSLAPHGHGPAATAIDRNSSNSPPKRCDMGHMAVAAGDDCRVELGLDLTA